ncbi:thiol-disulfide isomerase/thioredoxin [Balneicella halophila]|uniref:Thiol-disulfide isomerase/thioredoxin n=1 Tax=Balneicella halophila TaxID=1537566 RepID=A0A7L4UQM0_BALHA|nr:TlpA disulfide reductase family protein [Balneicella halophila]PVX51969.1 thiol-disulfide isomerase/thioredoxin [Balneicella halophila]
MKKLLWIAIATLVIVACTKEAPDYTVLSGKLENVSGLKEIRVRGAYDFSQVIEVKEDGTFADTLQPIKTGYYTLQIGRANLPMYLEQGDNLNVTVDISNSENPLSFSDGKAVAVNKYLADKNKASREKVAKLGGFQGIFGMEEDKFLETMKSMNEEETKRLDSTKNLPEKFIELEKKTIEYDYLYNLSLYPEYHAYVTKKEDYEAPESITKPLESLTYDNEKDYNEIGIYKQLVLSHFINRYYDDANDRDEVLNEVKGAGIESLKTDMARSLSQGLSLGAKDAKAEADRIKSLTSDEDVIKDVDKFLSSASELSEGKPSPKFTYPNINGKDVSLDDLKGKLVYIDVWATWCGPCKREIPFLKQLEKDYHNKAVHFVSISIDEKKNDWEKMVKDQDLKGIQLHAKEAWKSSLVQDYKINGIPRFILLDKEGNIITADAPRPSTDEIRTLLDEWLKK